MEYLGKNVIVFYIGVGVVMLLGFFLVKACGPAGSGTTPQSVATAPGIVQRADDMQLSTYGRMMIQAIESFRGRTGHLPTVADVASTGALAEYLPDWPANPYTGQPMKPGTEKGDYTYAPSADGTTYGFTLVYSDGPAKLQ